MKNRQLIEKGMIKTDWNTDNWSKKALLQLTEYQSQFNNWSKKSCLQLIKKVTLTTDRKSCLQLIEKHRTATISRTADQKIHPFYNWSKNGQLFEYQAQLIEYLPLQLIEKQTNDWSSTTDEKVTL